MNKKIIKNLIMVIASALLLLAATFAWQATGNGARVGEVMASVDAKVDVDYELFDGSQWVDIDTQTEIIGKLVPGREYRYRAIITAPKTKNVLGYSVALEGLRVTNGIGNDEVTTPENGEGEGTTELEYDVREHIFVRSYVVEGSGLPPEDVENYDFASYIGKGAKSVTIVKKGYFGDSVEEEESTTGSSEETTKPQTPTAVIKAGEQVTVYYSVTIQGQDLGDAHNVLSHATLDIGKVNILMIYDDATSLVSQNP